MRINRLIDASVALARAVTALHVQGVVHRDLTPEACLMENGAQNCRFISLETAAMLQHGVSTSGEDVSVNAHFGHWYAIPALDDQGALFSEDIIRGTGQIAYSMGCHGGLSVPDGSVAGEPLWESDFPQVLARQGAAAWIANMVSMVRTPKRTTAHLPTSR